MKYKREYCMDCKKDLSENQGRKKCECGSRNFIYGNKIVKTEKGFSCECGSELFKTTCHVNMNPKYITTMQCSVCGAIVGKEIFYQSPYL